MISSSNIVVILFTQNLFCVSLMVDAGALKNVALHTSVPTNLNKIWQVETSKATNITSKLWHLYIENYLVSIHEKLTCLRRKTHFPQGVVHRGTCIPNPQKNILRYNNKLVLRSHKFVHHSMQPQAHQALRSFLRHYRQR